MFLQSLTSKEQIKIAALFKLILGIKYFKKMNQNKILGIKKQYFIQDIDILKQLLQNIIQGQINQILIKMAELEKPKKIVINNMRKSIMAGGGLSNSGGPIQNISTILPSSPTNIQPNLINNANKEIAKIAQQMNYYKQKNDQSLIKVRFLTQKLQSYGGLQSIPQTITNQISQTDAKIKNLQQLLYFKRSKQMKKMKKKILKFIEMLQFKIDQQDLNKIEDEIQIIFFLIDIFSQKYNHMMTQKNQIDQIIQTLKEDTVFNRQQLQEQNRYFKEKQSQQIHYIRDLQLQIFNLKKDANNILRGNPTLQSLMRNQSTLSSYSSPSNNRIYDQTIKSLQQENQGLISKINKLQNTNRNNQYEIVSYKRKIQDYEIALNNQRMKCRDLQQQLLKVQRQEVRWKQRYELMERQKNQRIQLLEKQKRSIQNVNRHSSPKLNKSSEVADKKGSHRINIRKKMQFDPRFRINDQIIQDSGEEYYDVTNV